MLYALVREDGGVTVMTVYPKEIIVGEKTLRVLITEGLGKRIIARDEYEDVVFPMSTIDQRTYDVDSIPDATIVFHDIAKLVAENADPIVSYARITVANLPTTREYRNAWVYRDSTIAYDMDKAKNIHREQLRKDREPLLAALDVAYQRADEANNIPLKRRIAAEKQKLRDITSHRLIASAADIAALRILTIEYLLAHP